jgi:Galactose-binding domain-like
MKNIPILLILISLLLTACGGGGGESIDKGETSSSSSSSVATVTNCSNVEGAVFIDVVCSPWRSLSAYEQLNVSPWTGGEVLDGSSGSALEFSIKQSTDAGHGSIIDIRYFNSSNYSGSVRMRAPESSDGEDFSEYATGVLRFDLKVLQESLGGADLELSIDCGWPCGNTPIYIRPTAMNQWQTFEISIQELIEKGLDIKKIDFGFSLYPTWEKQQGAHFQLDNIRWIKGDSATSTKQVCYSNFFDTRWVSGVEGPGVRETTSDNIFHGVTKGVNPYAKINPDWLNMPDTWMISFSEAISYTTGEFLKPSTLSSCSGSGEITFDIYTSKALVDDATMSFTVHFMDKNSVVYEIPGSLKLVADMTADDWNHIAVTLPSREPYENLKLVGLTIDSTNVNVGSDAYFYVDNIRIVKPVP